MAEKIVYLDDKSSFHPANYRPMICHDVFISYKSQYVDIVKAISHVLEEENIRCWYAPRDLDSRSAGVDYDDAIFRAISACRVVVVVLTDEALESEWVKTEIAQAQNKRKLIIPYVVGKITCENGLLMRLQQKHWIDAYPNPERKFSLLVNNVKILLNETLKEEPGQDGNRPLYTVAPAGSDSDFDFDYEEGEALYRAKEYNEAIVALAASAERGNPKAQKLVCKLFYDLDKRSDEVSPEIWDMLERQSKAGHCYACFAMHTKYYRDYRNYYISFDYLKKAVREQNLGHAFLRLGIHYAWGMGVKLNYTLAVHYYERAIKLGCAEAYSYLGQQYEFGSDKWPADPAKTLECYRKGAQANDTRALMKLGNLYASGDIVEKDREKGFGYFQRMIDLGDCRGYSQMGLYHHLDNDMETAVKYYKKAALHDVADAFSSMAGICWNEGEKEDAYRWAKGGYLRKEQFAAYLLGFFYEQDEEYEKAWECYFCRYEWAGTGAEDLARLYVENKFRPEKMPVGEIIRMLDIAARGRNEEAVNRLIEIYSGDEFGCKDPVKVEEYRQLGVSVEMADQMYDCGVKMMGGDETSFNPYKGLDLIERAARKKYVQAVEFLIKVYEKGRYADREKCREWCRYGLDEELLSGERLSSVLKALLGAHFDGTAELPAAEFEKYARQARERLARGGDAAQPLRGIAHRLDPEFDPRAVEDGGIAEGPLFEKYHDYYWACDMDMRRADEPGPEFWERIRDDGAYAGARMRKAGEVSDKYTFWDNPNQFFDSYEELCKRCSITPQPFTRVERGLLLPPFITSRAARQFGRDVVRCMVSLFATGQKDILKCRQPVSDEDILNAAEACTDETVQWLLIGYVESRLELEGVFLWYNKLYPGGVLNPKAAEEWWTGYRKQLAELGIELEQAAAGAADAGGPQSETASDAGSGNDDDEFDRLLNEFIRAELDQDGEEKPA